MPFRRLFLLFYAEAVIMEETILQVNHLTKKYHKNVVLNDVSMTIKRGDIYGFVGKNGAGKTTLIRVISGLAIEDDGSFELFGVSSKSRKISQMRKKVCAMVESPSIYPDLSAYDNLKMQCLITKKKFDCINELLEFVSLSHTKNKPAKDFSLGMRQRLGIAMALVSEPEFMLLDEPINGLDPEGIKQVRELLLKMHREKNVTILISSHILTELALFATRYGFIDKGQIIKEATIEEIRNSTKEDCYITTSDNEKARVILESIGYKCEIINNEIHLKEDIDLMKTTDLFRKNDVLLLKHQRNTIDLENYFMDLLGGR